MQQHGWKRFGFSMLALFGGAVLLAGCTSEPSDPVILGVTPAAEVIGAASPTPLAVAAPKPAPTRTAERAKKPASHSAARNVRHRPVLARAAHWRAMLDTKQFAKARQARPVKVAAATRKVSRAPNEVIPIDTPAAR